MEPHDDIHASIIHKQVIRYVIKITKSISTYHNTLSVIYHSDSSLWVYTTDALILNTMPKPLSINHKNKGAWLILHD